MKVLYLDAWAGVSGDMLVGALLDVGASLEVVRRHVASLGIEGIELAVRRASHGGIVGTKFDVVDPRTGLPVDHLPHGGGPAEAPHRHPHRREGHGEHDHDHVHDHDHDRGRGHDHEDEHERGHDHGHGHGHGHRHAHGHDRDRGPGHDHGHAHAHDHDPGRGDAPAPQPERGLTEIRSIIRRAPLPAAVAEDALAVFELLACAEARVHGTDPEHVHFHEVGALDSIADVVAAASAMRQLGPDEIRCSPIHVGAGTVRCAHGVLPVPAPATLELLKGIPAYSDGTPGELATPTGVALLRHYCAGFSAMPHMLVDAVGYGAGSKELGIPNFVRATLGRRAARDAEAGGPTPRAASTSAGGGAALGGGARPGVPGPTP